MWVYTRTGDGPICKAHGAAKPGPSTGVVPRDWDVAIGAVTSLEEGKGWGLPPGLHPSSTVVWADPPAGDGRRG